LHNFAFLKRFSVLVPVCIETNSSVFYFLRLRFGAWVKALPAAERAARVNRPSPTTLAAARAALGPVVPPLLCAKALAAADLAALEVEVASVFPAFEAALLPVRSDIAFVSLWFYFNPAPE
jgi:hypothetical protein